MKKKIYIQPKVNTERMQICNILAGSYENIHIDNGDNGGSGPGEEVGGGDAKMFGSFGYFGDCEDEDY